MFVTCILLAIALIISLLWVRNLKKEISSLSNSCSEYLNLVNQYKDMLADLSTNLNSLEDKITDSIVEIRDKKPKKATASSYAMQLANELAPHIKIDKNDIVLKIWDEKKDDTSPVPIEEPENSEE